MMAVSSVCTDSVGDLEITRPGVVTTLSTLIRPDTRNDATTKLNRIQLMPRAKPGTGALEMAVDGD